VAEAWGLGDEEFTGTVLGFTKRLAVGVGVAAGVAGGSEAMAEGLGERMGDGLGVATFPWPAGAQASRGKWSAIKRRINTGFNIIGSPISACYSLF